VTRDEFLQGCLQLRGQAKSLDIAILLRELEHIQDSLNELGEALSPRPAHTSAPADPKTLPKPAGTCLQDAVVQLLPPAQPPTIWVPFEHREVNLSSQSQTYEVEDV